MNNKGKVSEFIDSKKRWQLDNLRNFLSADNIDKISCISIPINNIDDKLVWNFFR